MPVHVPAFVPSPMLIPLSCSGSPAILLSYHIFAFVSYIGSPALLSSHCMPALAGFAVFTSPHHTPIFCCRIPALLSPFPSIFSLPFFFNLHFLEHSNSFCQISFGPAYQPALLSPFVCSRLLRCRMRMITMAHQIQPIIINATGVLIMCSLTLAYWLAIMIKKRWT